MQATDYGFNKEYEYLPIFLRCLEEEDIDRVYKWHNDSNLYGSLTSLFRHVSRASVSAWLAKKQAFSSESINLAICLNQANQHIGNIYLQNIDWVARHAEISIFIGDKEYRQKGYGQKAVEILTEYAFSELGLKRLYLFVLEENIPAIKTYKKCGFSEEGKLRNHVFKQGKFKDLLVMGLINKN
jgi:RimJ/RimL family protein N-acetyltransferase